VTQTLGKDVRLGSRNSPYRGLLPYTEADADLFFGRETEVRLIANTAKARRFVVLYGPSGVGKSSVLQAGVVRQIRDENRRRFERFGAVETVVVYVKEWRDDPRAALLAAVRDAFTTMPGAEAFGEPPEQPIGQHVQDSGEHVVDEILRRRSDRSVDLLLILDQFEEFFLYHRARAEEFAELFEELTERGTRVNVLVSLREDALALLDEFEADIPAVFESTLRLEHLDAAAAEAAIRKPLDHYNAGRPGEQQVGIEDSLVTELLSQVRTGRVQVDSLQEKTGPGSLDDHHEALRIEAPYLQLVLTRLWDEELTRGSAVLRLATLRELGGAQEIVRQHLNRVMSEFTPPEMAVLADAFGHLVTPSGSKIAHRPSDLAEFSGRDPALVAALMHRLAEGDQRILRDVPPPLDDPHAEPRYEIFHDVLALAVLDWRRRFLAEAQSRRQQAELLAEKERVEQETRETRNRLRKARALIGAMALLLVVCLVLGVVAYLSFTEVRNSRNAALDAKDRARTAAREAERNKRLNDFSRKLNVDPSAALAEAMGFDLSADADPSGGFQDAFREAMDAADTDVVMQLGAPVLYAGFAGKDTVVAVTEDGHVRVWDVSSRRPVRLAEQPRFDVQVTSDASTRVVQAVPAVSDSYVVVLTDDHVVSSVDAATGAVQPLDRTFGDGVQVSEADTGNRNRVLVWDYQRNVAVWDVARNKVVSSPGPGERLDSGAIDASGRTVALVDGLRVDVWNLRTGRRTASRLFESHLNSLSHQLAQTAWVTFTGRPGVLLVAINGHKVEASTWDTGSDREVPLGDNLYWKSIYDVSDVWLADTHYLAVAGDKTVTLFADDGTFQAQTSSANDWITQVATSPKDSSVWALGAAEGYTSVYRTNLYPPRASWTFRGQQGRVQSLTFSEDGRNLVSGSVDGSVRIWRIPDVTLQWYIPDWIGRVNFSPDGAYTFGATPSGGVVRQDRDDQLSYKYADLAGQAVDMASSPDGRRAVLTETYCVMPAEVVLDGDDPVTTFAAPPKSACATVVAWNPDPARNQLVAGTYENQLVSWDATTGAVLDTVSLGSDASEVHSIAISADGSTIVAGTGSGVSGQIHVLSADDLTERTAWATADVNSVAVSADGRYVVAAGTDKHLVNVWDAETGELVHQLTQASGTLGQVTVSPDEDATRIAVTTSSGDVYVWARESGQLLAVMHRHADAANEAVFDPQDIDQMVSGGDDGFLLSYSCGVCSLGVDDLKDAAKDRLAQEIDLGD
jgi:WD40 repeat protein